MLDFRLLPRIVIGGLSPGAGSGGQPVKGTVQEPIEVRAILLCDGNEEVHGNLILQFGEEEPPHEIPMHPLGNDLWAATLILDRVGRHHFTVEAYLDPFAKWKRDVLARLQADVLTATDLEIGAALLEEWVAQAHLGAWGVLQERIGDLRGLARRFDREALLAVLADSRLDGIANRDKRASYVRHPGGRVLVIEPEVARFGAWYEFFPRSFAREPGCHGTLKEAEAHLEYVAGLGFDVVYLPPIHPIGTVNRKGKDNALRAEPGDVGCPWAIGSAEGGHKTIHPALGSMGDFEHFVEKARGLGLELALDVALQCSPDHPYVALHPDWFMKRPDGSIQFAENPPKKYEDIYPFDFQCRDRAALWEEMKSIFLFWIGKGVRIFRVDNPHTKPLLFWQWLIEEVKREFPETVFLSEAFTRPHIMKFLARAGFSQSYTYFTWRTGKQELTDYLLELRELASDGAFRPSFWPNTPDILSGPLRGGGPAEFKVRAVLAATLSPSYGIYGPAFELCENRFRDEESEEYAHSEKYELKRWNVASPASIAPVLRRLNEIRRSFRAMRHLKNLAFHPVSHDSLLAYSNHHDGDLDLLLVVVNLGAREKAAGTISFPFQAHGWREGERIEVRDLLDEATYQWSAGPNYVELDPAVRCAHIFHLRKRSGPGAAHG